jgi:beta-glucanase (GH16 family)
MEHVGNNPGWTSSAIHNLAGYAGGYFGEKQYIADVTSEFHVYGILWTEDKIEFTVDNEVHFTYSPTVKDSNNWPFTAKQFLILNIAMGGNLGGNIPPTFTESTMEIDYVRVYQ